MNIKAKQGNYHYKIGNFLEAIPLTNDNDSNSEVRIIMAESFIGFEVSLQVARDTCSYGEECFILSIGTYTIPEINFKK